MEAEQRICKNCTVRFSVEPDDFAFYQNMDVPPPTWCPPCRAQRRMIWGQGRSLYKRVSDSTGKEIFSHFHPSVGGKVIETDLWWSDSWSAEEYARDIDWDKPFLQQFYELYQDVPRPARSIQQLENSDYCNNISFAKNCYLVFNANVAENSYYSGMLVNCKEIYDSVQIDDSELCYDCFLCAKCFHCFYSIECENSSDLFFCKNVKNSNDCFGSVNLTNKQYCFFNEQLSKEEYEKRLKQIDLGSWNEVQRWKEKVAEFWKKFPVKYVHQSQTEDCTGDYIYQSSTVRQSFNIRGGEQVKYSQNCRVPTIKDTYDYSTWGVNVEKLYECSVVGNNINNLKFCFGCYPQLSNAEYCINCVSSDDLFGCVGVKKKKNCILNKQYTAEEYQQLVPKIKQHMQDLPYIDTRGRVWTYGEFFPTDFCPWAYNESLAQELYPKTKAEALDLGFTWRETETREYAVTLSADQIPDQINQVREDILKETIGCVHAGQCEHGCTTAFRLLPQELALYKAQNIPVPRACPACRHGERMKFQNPPEIWNSVCSCAGLEDTSGVYQNQAQHSHGAGQCGQNFETGYPKEKQLIVYCQDCYLAEMR